VNFLCKLTDVESDDAIVTNGLRRLLQQFQSTFIDNGPLIILGAASRLHLLSEQVLSLFSYTLSIPVRFLLLLLCLQEFLVCKRPFQWKFVKNGFVNDFQIFRSQKILITILF
jgi:hypothetical protein